MNPAGGVVVDAGEYGEIETRLAVRVPGAPGIEVWQATAQACGRRVRGFGLNTTDAVISCLFECEDAKGEMPQRVPASPPDASRLPGARLLARSQAPERPAGPVFSAGTAPVGTVVRISGSAREILRCRGWVFEKTAPGSWLTTGNDTGESDAFVQAQADRDGVELFWVPGPPSFRGAAYDRRP